jgi:hypothetical protein
MSPSRDEEINNSDWGVARLRRTRYLIAAQFTITGYLLDVVDGDHRPALALQTERPALTRTNRPSAIRGL